MDAYVLVAASDLARAGGPRGAPDVVRGPDIVLGEPSTRLGRSVAGRDTVRLPMGWAQVSGQHCRVYRDGDQFFVEDTSTNGTYINDAKIPRNESRPLNVGDTLHLTIATSQDPSYVAYVLEHHANYEPPSSADKRKAEAGVSPEGAAKRAKGSVSAAVPDEGTSRSYMELAQQLQARNQELFRKLEAEREGKQTAEQHLQAARSQHSAELQSRAQQHAMEMEALREQHAAEAQHLQAAAAGTDAAEKLAAQRQEEAHASAAALQKLRGEHEELQERVAQAQADLAMEKQSRGSAMDELNNLKKEYEAVRKHTDDLDAQLTGVLGQLEIAQQQRSDAQAQLLKQAQAHTAEQQRLQGELEAAAEALSKAEAIAKAAMRTAVEQAAKQHVAELAAEKSRSEELARALERDRKHAEDVKAELQERVDVLQMVQQSLHSSIAKYEALFVIAETARTAAQTAAAEMFRCAHVGVGPSMQHAATVSAGPLEDSQTNGGPSNPISASAMQHATQLVMPQPTQLLDPMSRLGQPSALLPMDTQQVMQQDAQSLQDATPAAGGASEPAARSQEVPETQSELNGDSQRRRSRDASEGRQEEDAEVAKSSQNSIGSSGKKRRRSGRQPGSHSQQKSQRAGRLGAVRETVPVHDTDDDLNGMD